MAEISRFNENEWRDIVDIRMKRKTVEEVATAHNITPRAVYKWLKHKEVIEFFEQQDDVIRRRIQGKAVKDAEDLYIELLGIAKGDIKDKSTVQAQIQAINTIFGIGKVKDNPTIIITNSNEEKEENDKSDIIDMLKRKQTEEVKEKKIS